MTQKRNSKPSGDVGCVDHGAQTTIQLNDTSVQAVGEHAACFFYSMDEGSKRHGGTYG